MKGLASLVGDAPAGRIRCSRSECFIHAPPFGGSEHAREGRRLPQADGRFVRACDQRGDFRPRAIENLAPLAERARHAVAVARDPFFEIPPGRAEEPPVGFDLPCDHAVHREAARLDDAVRQQTGRDRRRGLGAAGRGTSGAAVIYHAIIVTSDDDKREPAPGDQLSIKKFFPAAIALGASDSSLSLTPVSLRRRASLMR